MTPIGMKALYIKGIGLNEIADRCKHSIGFVRRSLSKLRVKIRGRGRPAGAKKTKKSKGKNKRK